VLLLPLGRAAEDLVQNRWVLGDRVFPRGPDPGVLEHCRWPVRSAGVPPPGGPRYVSQRIELGVSTYENTAFHTSRSYAGVQKGTIAGEPVQSR
jgi:hypothetical protein